MIRIMTIDDYDGVRDLWMKIKGFGIRSIDDSREGVEQFLKRNPTTSVVAVEDGKIVGSILCGHDGRRGCFYHVCVDEKYRMPLVLYAVEGYRLREIAAMLHLPQGTVKTRIARAKCKLEKEVLNDED